MTNRPLIDNYVKRVSISENLKPGDIAVVYERGLATKLSSMLIIPRADFFHFFLVADYIPAEMDFVIYESIPSHGVSVGRLSWYFDKKVDIYRPDPELVEMETEYQSEYLGQLAVWEATKRGRIGYDYSICVKLFFLVFYNCFRNLIKFHKFNCPYTNIRMSRNRRLLCTEMIDEAYCELFAVFDRYYELLPANFMQSIISGRVQLVLSLQES